MLVKTFFLFLITINVHAQSHIISKIDMMKHLNTGSFTIIDQEIKHDLYWNTTVFSLSFISDNRRNKNFISSNALIYLVNLIETPFTKMVFIPFTYSTFSIEKNFISKEDFLLNIKIGQETNYYFFYNKSDVTTETYLGLMAYSGRISLGAFIDYPWHNRYINNEDPFLTFNLSIRFN